MDKIKIGISRCLLGAKVRYDGQHKHDRYITGTLGNFFEWVGYCPEAECGMSIPRAAMRLVGTVKKHKLLTINTGEDKTEMMLEWISETVPLIKKEELCGYIFKAKSPSSGLTDIKIYTKKGAIAGKGRGLFAARFIKEYPLLPVIDEGKLHDVGLRENFLEHVFVYSRWLGLLKSKVSVVRLQEFHQKHKYVFMSHSQVNLRKMGRLVADADAERLDSICEEYLLYLTDTMRAMATIKKHTNVLEHLAGYFKNDINVEEKIELGGQIKAYHDKLVPLIVPVTLLSHYVRKYKKEYLADQYYVNALPAELMLRNYV